MIVEQIWTANQWRNYNYLVACSETGQAVAIDPVASDLVLATAAERGWDITRIVNTHEHGDHTGGNDAVVAATGAKVLAHPNAAYRLSGIDVGLSAGDVIKVGRTVELEVMETPGHTMAHVCLHAHGDEPCLFCGDTLFNAGAGNCHNGGNVDDLYLSFTEQLCRLPDHTRIFPGHDYIERNIAFTLDREPGNPAATQLQAGLSNHDPAQGFVTTIAMEREINVFFRLHNPEVVEQLAARFPDLPRNPDARLVFAKLRELRDSW